MIAVDLYTLLVLGGCWAVIAASIAIALALVLSSLEEDE